MTWWSLANGMAVTSHVNYLSSAGQIILISVNLRLRVFTSYYNPIGPKSHGFATIKLPAGNCDYGTLCEISDQDKN